MSEQLTPPAATQDYQVTGRRIVAALIDLIPLIAVYLALAATIGDIDTEGSLSTIGDISTESSVFVNLSGAAAVLFFVLVLAYYTVSEALAAMTLGKFIMGLKVVKADGSPFDLQASLVRNVLRIVDVLPFLYLAGLVFVAVTAKNQRVGDLAARTLVVRA